jgi:hypothetical protein
MYYRQRQAPNVQPHTTDIDTLDHMVRILNSLEEYDANEKMTPKRAEAVAGVFLRKIAEVLTRSSFGTDTQMFATWSTLRLDAEALARAGESRDKSDIISTRHSLALQLIIVRGRVREALEQSPETRMGATIFTVLEAEKPAMVQEFITMMQRSFERLREREDWRGLERGKYGDYARKELQATLSYCTYRYNHCELADVEFSDEKALKAGEAYAAAIVEEMSYKMGRKLGHLTDVEVTFLRPGANELTLRGRRGEQTVLVAQQRVSHVNQNGTWYQQYPALIYLNGIRVSEAEYKAK